MADILIYQRIYWVIYFINCYYIITYKNTFAEFE
jgi:hypothetical protein